MPTSENMHIDTVCNMIEDARMLNGDLSWPTFDGKAVSRYDLEGTFKVNFSAFSRMSPADAYRALAEATKVIASRQS